MQLTFPHTVFLMNLMNLEMKFFFRLAFELIFREDVACVIFDLVVYVFLCMHTCIHTCVVDHERLK